LKLLFEAINSNSAADFFGKNAEIEDVAELFLDLLSFIVAPEFATIINPANTMQPPKTVDRPGNGSKPNIVENICASNGCNINVNPINKGLMRRMQIKKGNKKPNAKTTPNAKNE